MNLHPKDICRLLARRLPTLLALLILAMPVVARASASPYERGLRQVRELVSLQRFDDAEYRLTAMLRQYPGNPELLAYRGRVRLWQKLPANAILDFKQSLARRDDRGVRKELAAAVTALKVSRAEAHLFANETAEAEKLLRELFDSGQDRYRTGLMLGKAYTSKGAHARATEVYRALSEEYPGEYDISLLLVRSLIRTGYAGEARQVSARLPTVDHTSIHLARATIATSDRDYDEALALYGKALKLKDDELIRAEMVSVEMQRYFRKADEAINAGRPREAADILRDLYGKTDVTYDVAHRLGRLALERNDYVEALVVYRHLMTRYPGDDDARTSYFDALLMAGRLAEANSFLASLNGGEPQWQLRRARLLYREGRFTEAAAEFRKVEQSVGNPEVARELFNAERAARLKMAERLAQEGDSAGAERMWRELYDSGVEQYEPGVKLARLAQQRGDFNRALAIYTALSGSHPKDTDLLLARIDTMLAMNDSAGAESLLATLAWDRSPQTSLRRARSKFRLKQYEAAVAEFRAAGDSLEPTVRKERETAENALSLEKALVLMRAGKVEEATALWRELFDSGRERYESGYQLGMGYLRQGQYELAKAHFNILSAEFAKDPGLFALAVESSILTRDMDQAATMVRGATPARQEYLTSEREDLLYRVRPNYLMLSGTLASFDNGQEMERGLSLTLSQRISRNTLVMNAGEVHRYGLDDTEFGAELFFPIGENRKLTGDLAITFSPTARFLPETVFRGELTYSLAGIDYSAGYTRMNFKSEGVDILVLGGLGFLTPTLTLNERVYIVPARGSASLVSTLHYEPSHRLRGYYSLGFGTTSDRIGAQGDLDRYFTLSNRFGLEYRPTPIMSTGGEIFHEVREKRYSRYGAQLYVKYWW